MQRANRRHPASHTGVRLGLTAAALWFALPAWALHWPWHHRASTGTQPVQVLAIDLQADGATVQPGATASPRIQQYWDRNALLLDLTQVPAFGGARLAPRAGDAWPVRLEFRVRPGGFGRLEVRAAQRLIFSVPSQGAPLVLKLDPSVYQADTAQISLQWSAAGDSAH